MDGLIKTTAKKLTGTEKAAILLSEIGPADNTNYDALFKALHLSADEIKKIRQAMNRLNTYAPGKVSYEEGLLQIQREQAVLTEALAFGIRKGLVPANVLKTSGKPGNVSPRTADKPQLSGQKPEEVAKVIRSWLGDKE